jgi:hypothetical protein
LKLALTCDDDTTVPEVKMLGTSAAIAITGKVSAIVRNHHLCFANLAM